MGFFDFFRNSETKLSRASRPAASDSTADWVDLSDPRLSAFLRDGELNGTVTVTNESALRNMAVFRSVDLLTGTMGMLPFYLMQKTSDGNLVKHEDHSLYDVLLHKPNAFQTAHQFKSHMQANALIDGNAYALIVRSTRRVMQLVPLDSSRVTPRQNADWTLTYHYQKPAGGSIDYPADDILHIRGLSRDGILGLSRTKIAREAIDLALQAERAANRLYRNGMMVGGVVTHPQTLSDNAYARLQQSLYERYVGVENAHKSLLLEEGMTYKEVAATATNAQTLETRNLQIEEVARAFGVPRPLLMQDSTNWGTGIEQLAILFVRFGLAPWFSAWEGECNIKLLSAPERKTLYTDFDERELLRGSTADQGEFFSKALGAGGHAPWMTQNEIRELSGVGPHPDGNSLTNPMTAKSGGPAPTNGVPPNVP